MLRKKVSLLFLCAGIFLCGNANSAGASSAPTISPNGVVNAASFEPVMSPGSLATVFGANLSTATNANLYNGSRFVDYDPKTGVKVYVAGRKCPLLYVSPTQINFQIPWETSIGVPLGVQVMTNGITGNPVQIVFQAASPGSFKWTCPGVVNAGAGCTLWGNGFGPINPPQADGVPAGAKPLPKTVNECSLTIGGVSAKVTYCGMAPGLIINQLNFVYPDGVQGTGMTTEAKVTVGGVTGTIQVGLPFGVTINPPSATIAAKGTQQFTAQVSGAANASVAWSVTGGGTITQAGLYTAPAATASMTATITALATASKSSAQAQATVAVTRAITIDMGSNATGGVFYTESWHWPIAFLFNAPGAKRGDTLHIMFRGQEFLRTLDTWVPGDPPFAIGLEFQPSDFTSAWIELWVTGSDGVTSNVLRWAYIPKHNRLTRSADRAFVMESMGTRKFKLADGSPSPNDFLGAWGWNVVYDATSNFLVFSDLLNVALFNPDTPPATIGGASIYFASGVSDNGKSVEEVAALNGYGCVTQPDAGLVSGFTLTNLQAVDFNPPMVSAGAGKEPWAAAMATLGNELDCVVYSREDTSLWRISVPDMAVKGGVQLQGFTPRSQIFSAGTLASGVLGGWDVVAFSSEPAAGTAAVLSEFDNALAVVNLASMTETHRVTLQGNPYQIAADIAHGRVVVAFADVAARLTRFASVDIATGTVTPLATTVAYSDSPLIGFDVSSDGANIYASGWDQGKVVFNILPNR